MKPIGRFVGSMYTEGRGNRHGYQSRFWKKLYTVVLCKCAIFQSLWSVACLNDEPLIGELELIMRQLRLKKLNRSRFGVGFFRPSRSMLRENMHWRVVDQRGLTRCIPYL